MAICTGQLPFVPQIHLHPSSSCSAPWRQTCTHCLRASLWCPTGFIQRWHPQEAVGLGESRVWVFIPHWVSAAGCVPPWKVGFLAAHSTQLFSLALTSVHSQVLTIARCYPVTCGFPVPCFISNTFIKLHSDCPIWISSVSCWDLINYLSSSMINFL